MRSSLENIKVGDYFSSFLYDNMGSRASLSGGGGINDEALGKYLFETGEVPGLKLPIVTTEIGYGQSNPTFFVDDAA